MRAPVRVLLLSAVAIASIPVAGSAADAQSRPRIMVVGSIHMANPGADFANMQMDDITTPKRQAEVAELVRRLATFRPTKVAVETTPQRDSALNADYQAWRSRSRELTRNEREQVGFRLAAQFDHPRLYGIDSRGDLDVGAVFQFAAANGMGDFVMETQKSIAAVMAESQEHARTLAIPELIATFNQPTRDAQFNAIYLRAARISKDTVYPGAKLAADWYARNARILAHLHRVVTSPDDRVVIVIGAAHAAILRSMIRDAGTWELVDPVPVLLGK